MRSNDVSPDELKILETLAAQPWLTARQLAHWSAIALPLVQTVLDALVSQRRVLQVGAHLWSAPGESAYALSARGVRLLMRLHATDLSHSSSRSDALTHARYRELLWSLERVWQVRELIQELGVRAEWQDIGVLRRLAFQWRGRTRRIHLHGCAWHFPTAEPNGVPFVVEWENEYMPTPRHRLGQLLRWQAAVARDVRTHRPAPLILLVVPEADRAWERLEVLRELARQDGLVAPCVAVTIAPWLALHGAPAPIWFGLHTGTTAPPFAGMMPVEFHSLFETRPRTPPLAYLSEHVFSSSLTQPTVSASAPDLFQMRLTLTASARRTLWLIAVYPALTADELALVGSMPPAELQAALIVLLERRLADSDPLGGIVAWRVTRLGLGYLTAEAGWGTAVKTYTRLRGWHIGWRRLGRQPEHTRAANAFFIACLREARRRGAHLDWQSEIECARLLRWRRGKQLFLPDGLGRWQEGEAVWYLALEIERSRQRRVRAHGKFKGYVAAGEWSAAPWSEVRPLLTLVVTTGWDSARRLCADAAAVTALYQARPLDLWLTTVDALSREGVGAAIWRSGAQWETLQPLPFFQEE